MPILIALAGLALAVLVAAGAAFLAILEAVCTAPPPKQRRRKPSRKVHWEEYSGEELDAFLKGLGR